ncbi:hypothetical protein [Pollutibacter soli]|uniref:hypothetical protein n=1 Tax=Pollutibacter soli TaxID=3034157 RepID=UPI003013D7EF
MKNFILAFVIVLPLATTAQKKVDLDRYNFTAQFRALPQIRLDTNYRTYNVKVSGTSMMQSIINEMNAEQTVELEGWKKLSSRGHITVDVKVDDILPEAVEVKERVEQIKDKNGKITGQRVYYRQEVVYTFAVTAQITDYKGAHIREEQLVTRQSKKTYSGPEFPNRQIASGYFLLNSIKVTKDLFKSNLNNALHNLSDRISSNFGYRVVNVNDHMWIVDSRKHPEYDAHRQAFLKLNDIFFRMTADSPVDSLRKEAKPVIDYFEKIKRVYSSSSKHDRKIRYASYFNLAVLYYYLDDPQMMMKEAKGLVLNDFDAKDGKGFEQTARWLKDLFDQTNRYTRHFPMDIESFRGPYEKEVIVADKASL